MRLRATIGILLTAAAWPTLAQEPPAVEEDFSVYTEHPRLFLNQRRLRLLQREKQRESIRWQQFELLMAGKVQMPEPGFAHALFSQASGDAAHCKTAIQWASGAASDLRQIALVFDWCQEQLSEGQSRALIEKLRAGIQKNASSTQIPAVRSRVLAAVALGEHLPDVSRRELKAVVERWWRGKVIPELKAGRNAIPREELYPLIEMMHALRDNINIDLREGAPPYFRELPYYQVLSYYPSPYPAAENEYRIPMFKGTRPDLRHAILARAADLATVAYESNAVETQFLQGWLIHDQFLMRGTLGIAYEFLWANPYHPGLSYFHIPLVFHDPDSGRLFIRSSWEEDAIWFGYLDGQMQLFEKGVPKPLEVKSLATPLAIGAATLVLGTSPMQFKVTSEARSTYYVVGLKPGQTYRIEIDDEEMAESRADAGGTLALPLPAAAELGVRLREAPHK